ncbi:MAG: hypothetical protein J0M29_13400 [Chitinophagales bacterium]|nr:hypothetical protein [Chitinophagales bacterium]
MQLKISAIWVTTLFITAMFILATNACKKDEKVDCSKITGATFSSNSGKMQAILASKCTNGNCHNVGNDGAQHWAYYTEYDSLTPHFEHMYEAVVIEKEMPQAGSPQLTEEEIDAFECRKQAGFPE